MNLRYLQYVIDDTSQEILLVLNINDMAVTVNYNTHKYNPMMINNSALHQKIVFTADVIH
jgi:hypothetical protein